MIYSNPCDRDYVITSSDSLETPRQVNATVIAIRHSNARIILWDASAGPVYYVIGFTSDNDYTRFCEEYDRLVTDIVEKTRKHSIWHKIKVNIRRIFS